MSPSEVMELAQQAAAAEPRHGLRAVAALRRLLERLEALHVDRARAAGWSWQEIADELGVTKQSVHRKHHRRRGG
jgi:DNA-directed RNA polymerase specialized sigma24 family protein